MSSKVLINYFFENPSWKESYPEFHKLLSRPLGWFYAPAVGKEKDTLRTIDTLDCCDYYAASRKHQAACQRFLKEFSEKSLAEEGQSFPKPFTCHAGRKCMAFAMNQAGVPKGFILSCNLKAEPAPSTLKLFREFINAITELAFRTHELHNFYETVHPRAVALSTMHSVHRLVRQSISTEELLPRIARLAAQIVKATDCSIYLLDDERKYLIPSVSIGEVKKRQKIRVGKGLEGRSADTGDFILQKNKLSVPLIKDDVAGIMVLENKKDNLPFTRVDLEILKTLSEQAVLAIKNAELFEESEKLTEGSIKSINDMLELNKRSTSFNMPFFKSMVRTIAQDLDLSDEEQNHVEQASSLLDVGHAGISEKILSKPGKLTKKEFDQIKQHPSIGVRVLGSIHSLKPVLPIILTHHERYDGKGYPEGLKGTEIPLGARIIAVVDAFSAMTSDRPYRKKLSALEALREIEKESGRQFDPAVVKSFIKLLETHKEWRSL